MKAELPEYGSIKSVFEEGRLSVKQQLKVKYSFAHHPDKYLGINNAAFKLDDGFEVLVFKGMFK
ncbi:g021 [Yersinia phage phiR1-37]|uniref:hypothetical protein n=1 Tax=Yersinia phage phiR1-37 TaxID=331278 RepID=UPI00022DBCC1|nr:hypothetical protein phiR1-37_gp021 [Yersinia phage phiR1-37]CCE26045.1 g021 [Yersinia phage phiR1-37]